MLVTCSNLERIEAGAMYHLQAYMFILQAIG